MKKITVIHFRHLVLFYLIFSLSWNLFAKVHMKCKKSSVGHHELQLEMDMSVPRIQRRHNPAICGDMIAPCLLWVIFFCSIGFTDVETNWIPFIGVCNLAISVICPLTMLMSQPIIKEHFKSCFQYFSNDTIQPMI